MSGKRKHRTANEYLQYLKGELTPEERHALEKELQADPFEREAMEGLESISPGEAEQDILALHSRLAKRKARKRRIVWYSAAASVASLLIIGTIFLQVYDFNPTEKERSGISESERSEMLAEPEPEVEMDKPLEETITGVEVEDAEVEVAETQEIETRPEPEAQRLSEPAAATGIAQEPPSDVTVEALQEPIVHMEAGAVSVTDEMPDEVALRMEEIPDEDAIRIQELSGEESRMARTREEPEPVQQPELVEVGAVEPEGEKMDQRAAMPVAARPVAMQRKALTEDEFEQITGRRISGVVRSGEDLQPLAGAIVAIKGSTAGVVTNMEGGFELPLQDDTNRTIVAGFVGMETMEYQLEDMAEIELLLKPDPSSRDELVVMGAPILLEDQGQAALPSGGIEAFRQYIEREIQYPEPVTGEGTGMVVLSFTVTSGGELKEIMALRSPGQAYTEEAIRLIREGPSWIPAKDEAGNIDEVVRLGIRFRR